MILRQFELPLHRSIDHRCRFNRAKCPVVYGEIGFSATRPGLIIEILWNEIETAFMTVSFLL